MDYSYTMQMRPTPRNIANVSWIEGGRRAAFAAERAAYGIEVAPGEFVSFNGVSPSVWDTKKVAQFIADTTDFSEVATVKAA